MTTQSTSTRDTLRRNLLAVALLVMAGVMAFVVLTYQFSGQPAVLLAAALLPVAAAGLLFVSRAIGAALALVAAAVGALLGLYLSVCLFCSTPTPVGIDAIALFVTALVIVVLAVAELRALGLAWVAVAFGVGAFLLVSAGNPILLAVGVLAVVVYLLLAWRRRRARE